MIFIFLSFSGKDVDTINAVIENLKTLPSRYRLWYYHKTDIGENSMEKILKEELFRTDIFVLFITQDSLASQNVQQEIEKAIRLTQNGSIKEICPIILDGGIFPASDGRIPEFIKNCNIYYADSPETAAHIIRETALKY